MIISPKGYRLSKSRAKDIAGQKFNRLTVIRYVGSNYRGDAEWLCKCDCGNEIVTTGYRLRNGTTNSCGCLHKEITSKGKFHTTHGMHGSPEYSIWSDIKKRCNPKNKNNPKYRLYAGRGIKVCKRWHRFENFLADMGVRPSPKHSIDRRNNNGDYTPDNCYWATDIEQANNKRSNVRLTWQGRTLTAAEWSREVSIPASVIRDRYKAGWHIDRILTQPLRRWDAGEGN